MEEFMMFGGKAKQRRKTTKRMSCYSCKRSVSIENGVFGKITFLCNRCNVSMGRPFSDRAFSDREKKRPFIMGLFSEEESKKKAKPLAKILDKKGYDLFVAKVGDKKSDDEKFRKVGK